MLGEKGLLSVRGGNANCPAAVGGGSTPPTLPWGDASTSQPPVLVEQGYSGFNLVQYQERYFALALSLGVVELTQVDAEWLTIQGAAKTVFIGESLLDVKRQVGESTSDQVLEAVPLLLEHVQA